MLTEIQFQEWRLLVEELTGIYVDPDKKYLMETRLEPLLELFQCDSLETLKEKVKHDYLGALPGLLAEALTTHETSFFRDPPTFELFRRIFLGWFRERSADGASLDPNTFKVLSAGCSSGEEVYTAASIIHPYIEHDPTLEARVLGWDIANDTLKKARQGTYRDLDKVFRGVELARYFERKDNGWQVKPALRRLVQFEKFNLLDIRPHSEQFDVVLCRNVAIYFEPKTRTNFFIRLAQCIRPDGALILGASESLLGLERWYERLQWKDTYYYRPRC